MDFPVFLYKCPGAHFGPSGTTYEAVCVNNAEALETYLANGWHKTLDNAADCFLNKSVIIEEDGSPVTREELEQKATELKIKFDGRTSDKKLFEKINEALEGQ